MNNVEQLNARIEELERLCAEAYQVFGMLATECGWDEDEPTAIKVLDNLAAAKILHEDVLPFPR